MTITMNANTTPTITSIRDTVTTEDNTNATVVTLDVLGNTRLPNIAVTWTPHNSSYYE